MDRLHVFSASLAPERIRRISVGVFLIHVADIPGNRRVHYVTIAPSWLQIEPIVVRRFQASPYAEKVLNPRVILIVI